MHDPPRPLTEVPLVAGDAPPPLRHDTVLPAEPADADQALAEALAAGSTAALRDVVARWPSHLDAWARLGQKHLGAGDTVIAYACARVGYHRGLDRLRRHGWGGTGTVRWSQPTNRGCLRALQLLLVTAAALGEVEESARCRTFLLDLDPEDALGAAAYPEVPDATWVPPPLA